MDDRYFENGEKPAVVDEETANKNAFNPKEFYKMHPELNTAPLTGRFKRKLIRANTTHLRAICPVCGSDGMRFEKKERQWVCKKCGSKAERSNIEYVRYA